MILQLFPIGDQSTFVQVMTWCHHATSHYLNQCWPRSVKSYWSISLMKGHFNFFFKMTSILCQPHWVEDKYLKYFPVYESSRRLHVIYDCAWGNKLVIIEESLLIITDLWWLIRRIHSWNQWIWLLMGFTVSTPYHKLRQGSEMPAMIYL